MNSEAQIKNPPANDHINSKKNISIIVLCVISFIFIMEVFVYYRTTQGTMEKNQTKQTNIAQEPIQTNRQIPIEESLIKGILNAIKTEPQFAFLSAFFVSPSFDTSSTLWWIAPDDWNILVKEGKGLNINIPYDEDSTLLSPAEFPPFIQLHQFAKE